MYGQPYHVRQSLINLGKTRRDVWYDPQVHRGVVTKELMEAGITAWESLWAECRYLHNVIHPEEHIGGAIFGRHESGRVLMVATDRRLIFLDKKPLFTIEDEINYDAVSGIELVQAGLGSTVTIHTGIKDYKIRTLNRRAAANFTSYIEQRSLEHMNGGRRW